MSTCNSVLHTFFPSLDQAKDILKIEILLNKPVSKFRVLHNTFLAKFYNTDAIKKLFSLLVEGFEGLFLDISMWNKVEVVYFVIKQYISNKPWNKNYSMLIEIV